MNKAMIQWVIDYTGFREKDKTSRLDLLFTKEINLDKDINYECLFGMKDHVVLEIEIKGNMEDKQKESYKT